MEELNPVKKLHNLLEEAIQNGNPNASTIEALQKSQHFNCEADRTQQVVQFISLLDKAEKVVRSFKSVRNPDSYLKAIKGIQDIFILNSLFDSKWHSLKAILTNQNLITLLDTCVDMLLREEETFLRNDDLRMILESVEALIHKVNSSDLEEATKIFLRAKLEEICEAICQNPLEDPEKFRRAIKIVVGETTIGSISITEEEKEKPTFKETLDWISKFGALVTLSRQTQEYVLPHLLQGAHSIQHFLSAGN